MPMPGMSPGGGGPLAHSSSLWQQKMLSLPLFLLIFSAALMEPCGSAKILFTFFHDRGSHFGSMLPLMERLAQEGHSVHVLDTIFPRDQSKLVTHIRASLPQEDDTEEAKAEFQRFFWHETDSSVTLPEFFGTIGDGKLGMLLENHAEKVAQIVDEPWDVIVMDDLFWCFGFALSTLKQRLWERSRRGPEPRTIVYATAGQTLLSAESVKATSRNWVSKVPLFPFHPTNASDVYSPQRFTHRLFAFYENFAEHLLMNMLVEPFFLPNIARFGVSKFSWYEMYGRSSLQYSDSVDRMGWPLSEGPEVVNVGAHCKEAGQLPEDFRKFVEDPQSKGTVYVAFGSYPNWHYAPARILTALIDAFQRLSSYRIIFAYNGPPIPGLGPHILLAKWAPQLEILAHPKTKAYVTHGGLKSIREGLCAGVPLVVMPLFAEQAHNAQLVLAMGIGPVINKYSLTPESVYDTIHGQVLSNPESVLRAQRFRSIFLDRPMPALEEGTFWVNRLMRLRPGRRPTFVRSGIHLNWLQFAYADLAALLLLIALICAKG